MIQNIDIESYLNNFVHIPIVDVRSPGEYEQGHIPGAYNVSLFSNEERKEVGICYKHKGREQAILLALDINGPKWSAFIKQCLEIVNGEKKIALHCWRGGMRSGAMAWVLNLYGFEVFLISGGYKEYRKWVHRQFNKNYKLNLLGGYTGSGKTRLLQQLPSFGIQIVDLEHLAQHQGSAYGSKNNMQQPSQEQFENNMAMQLGKLDSEKLIWLEDECQQIGRCGIPNSFWKMMREAAVVVVHVPIEKRIASLVTEYGSLDQDFLVACTERIQKRVGPEQTKNALAAIRENRMADFIRIVLVYYDKTYQRGLDKRKPDQLFPLHFTETDISHHLQQLLTFSSNINSKTSIESPQWKLQSS